jgi:hypothetical protein
MFVYPLLTGFWQPGTKASDRSLGTAHQDSSKMGQPGSDVHKSGKGWDRLPVSETR